MKPSDGAVYVRRRPGEALDDNCTRKSMKHDGGKMMAWGCIIQYGGKWCTKAVHGGYSDEA